MAKAWPFWVDSRDGELYHLFGFATDVEDRLVYLLKHAAGGLNITSPAPGLVGCVIRQADEAGNLL